MLLRPQPACAPSSRSLLPSLCSRTMASSGQRRFYQQLVSESEQFPALQQLLATVG